jgi:hypothetical protein
MPQVPESHGWIPSHQLAEVPHGRLEASETDAFLDFLFRDVARRPPPLLLRETAAVVRYLRLLAQKGLPRAVANRGAEALSEYYKSPDYAKDRQARFAVERIAEALWGDLSQWGQINPCTKCKANRFLDRHSKTYLAGNPLLAPALKMVAGFEIPALGANEPKTFEPPNFMSGSLNVEGSSNPRLQDDLSERIYAAFHALGRSNVKKIRDRLAGALNKAEVERRKPDSVWTYDTVNERIKEYERRQRLRFRKTFGPQLTDEHVQRWRDQLVDRWIIHFRPIPEKQQQRPAH